MKYHYELLDPRPTEEAQAKNDAILSKDVLGLEVTVPSLAERCRLGNIDPQHLGGTACRACISEIMFIDQLPPAGTTLATVRADNDSLGAMALMEIIAEQDYPLPEDVVDRVAQIALADQEASGDWPGQKEVKNPEDYVTDTAVLSAISQDFKKPMAERVATIQEWLQTGTFEGMAQIRERLLQETAQALGGLSIRLTAKGVAVVEGNHRLAFSLGYAKAPIVVATNPEFRFAGGEPHCKHTVARYNSNVPMNWDGLKQELAEAEPGWGGSPSILGSPQGQASKLTTERVVSLTEKHLL